MCLSSTKKSVLFYSSRASEQHYIMDVHCVCVCWWDAPDMTSSSSMSLRPFLKSSSMFSICVPAFLKWELHQAVKVWERVGERVTLSPDRLYDKYIHRHWQQASQLHLLYAQQEKKSPVTNNTASLLRAGSDVHFSLYSCYDSGCWRWKCRNVQWHISLTAMADSTSLKNVEVTSGFH